MNMYQSTCENKFPGSGISFPGARVGQRVRALLRTLRTWERRSEERHALSQLSTRQLEDAGISPQQLYDEIHKPFWRA
jgi:uncharacterized protein YjiS (DUF1127 family)